MVEDSSKASPPPAPRLGIKIGKKAAAAAQAPSAAVMAIGEQLTAPLPADSGEDREIEIEKIRPDSENARRLAMTLEILTDPEPHPDESMREEVEAIRQLAASIKQDGLRHPITVYEDGALYRIATGERRYWACRLLNYATIQTRLLVQKPARLRRMQYSENVLRRDFNLRSQFINVQQVVQEAKDLKEPLVSVEDYQDVLNASQATAYRWRSIIEGPADVHQAIFAGKIRNVVHAASAASEKNAAARQAIIDKTELVEVPPTGAGGAPSTPVSKPAKKSASRGRPTSSVKLGAVKNTDFARWLIEKLDRNADRSKLDWGDMRAVSKAWKETLKKLEKKFEEGGLR
jgi:ParB family transcriptional regulator, chromosome partitioning protein